MVMLLQALIYVLLLITGVLVGKYTPRYRSKLLDTGLVILIILLTWIGGEKFFLLKVFDLEIKFSLAAQLLLLGVLSNRLFTIYAPSKRNA